MREEYPNVNASNVAGYDATEEELKTLAYLKSKYESAKAAKKNRTP